MRSRVNTPLVIQARLRQDEAVFLRARGMSYAQIAQALGYRHRACAFKAVKRVMETTRDRAALACRIMMRIRMERGLVRFVEAVESGDERRAYAILAQALAIEEM